MKIKIIVALLTLIPICGLSANNLAIQNYYKGDYAAAENGLVMLAENKNSEAAFYLGKMYLLGYGVHKDTQKGLNLILQAAKQNYIPAQMYLAEYYLVENNNFNEAFGWFQKAADLGNVEAQTVCATSYLYGYGVKKDVEKSRKYLIKAAQNGDSLAQYELGRMFLNNKSNKDQALGLLWLVKSAKSGNEYAQYVLGILQLTGTKVDKDIPQAISWLEKSASQGNAKARFSLGMYFLTLDNTDGVIVDNIKLAVHWFNQSLQTDHSDILNDKQSSLSKMVNNITDPKIFLNRSVAQKNADPTTFSDWLTLARQGDVVAAQQVGYRYYKGEGVAANKELGIKWLSFATAKNDYTAKIQLTSVQKQWQNLEKVQQTRLLTPKMVQLNKAQVFNQVYQLVSPDTLPIADIIKTLGKMDYQQSRAQLSIPNIKCSLTEKKYIQKNLTSIIREANLGYAPSQFKLGLAYQLGLGVKQDPSIALNWLQLSAKQNYLRAEYAIGVLALLGEGMPKNFEIAQNWLMKAALKGDSNAQFLLGQLYEFGYEDNDQKNLIKKNLISAKLMYGLAANNNNPQAQYDLARLYLSGLLAAQDIQTEKKHLKLAQELFRQAASRNSNAKLALAFFNLENKQPYAKQHKDFNIAKDFSEKNNVEGKLLLALMYDRGVGTEINKQKAAILYEQLAKLDNPIAQFILGSYYALGIGVEKNLTLAREYLAKATTAGLGYASYNLAMLDYHENNIASFLVSLKLAQAQDYQSASIALADYYLINETDSVYIKEAVNIYQQLANSGNANAQIKLAYMYQNGIYFRTDYEAAFEWYQKAADQGNPLAQFALGEMYQVGQVAERNLLLAIKWYKKAAQQQFAPAQVALGYINDVDREDYQQAQKWYELAAKSRQCPIANYNLALLYDYGKGLPANVETAKTFYERASRQGL